ncbi:MAG TPA: flavin prenyltransferase UbiX [Gemmatimonadaceae bacterium]|nr:flavin prenyltransferase UbiX [Gemmatimonadaceae bacterium]
MTARLPVVMAITGASGALYGVRLLEQLVRAKQPTWLIVSSHGWRLLAHEVGIDSMESLRRETGGAAWRGLVTPFEDSDRGAAPASGSARTRGMVICPCSMGTLSAIAHGSSRSLVERSADVILKERRALILVPRETPLSTIHLENMLTLSRAGAIVLPAAPGFYHAPRTVEQLADFVVARVLDHLGIEHRLARRWAGDRPRA